MKTKAAILFNVNRPLEIVELDIPALKPGQVLVEVLYSGVCHTQLLECRGHRGEDKFLPHGLGHEGFGKVVEISAGVSKVKPDDHVILSWIQGQGANVPSTTYMLGDKKVNSGAITTFSKYSIISENRLTLASGQIDSKTAALVGCAIPTGFGTVFNTLSAKPGQSIVIFGLGGVGLSATVAALVSGCSPVVVIDVNQNKIDTALKCGATFGINPSTSDFNLELNKILPKGADLSIDATGRPEAMELALKCVRNQGGSAGIIGNAHFGEALSINPLQFNLGKRLLGTWGGDNSPDTDFPKYSNIINSKNPFLNHYLSKMREDIFSLENINTALDDLENGKSLRPIIDMSL
jgi:S-(hydroxymethyl)glutathione dehydrogenase / alcohol dehydrogenase